ncbi:unnamed protein product [Aureobasidium uvarum]|uniref:Fungal calcium binding protein domain-containing protein n=1 Tax=Aureobasidium uvarum TaxID=2773716 RepID=A0A9N8KMX6_9PEZI|nr:unnamed protein product [Aureobasidium uvarum]
MQLIIIASLAFAASAIAASAEDFAEPQVLISLPAGCSKGDLATASCGAAIIGVGANPAADLACVGSAAGTAANIADCKNCSPKSTRVIKN